MMRTLTRGVLAGAAGTTALNTVTYTDMALRGRPSSSTPERVVDAMADRAGVAVPGSGDRREARLSGLGALSGIAVGGGVGAVGAALGRTGVRLPWWAGAAVTGALAMAASDVPVARFGISDPRTWSAADWLSDVLPHPAYGLVTYGAVSGAEARP
ncbi:hypothetical protein VSR01_01790 [Actinacidiphila sp. DG2A-62]|uniref:hypothetical protein n=1 Tax=Actinacidiphila sp. DG2A-62 TaxID=3108821 RepID=UPI002DB9791A|nr:hypothetical protein [Actinacidiphila sp. DG2A-62]MEC3992343.1 hypothetical protein [Actinacidiphila sp. DG2A-62]